MPGFPVHHQLLEFTQTHVHLVGDAIYPCNPLSSTSSPVLNPSQHQGLFTQNHVHLVGDAIYPCNPLSSTSSPVLNLSQHQGLLQ